MCGTTGRREIAYLHEGKDRIDDIIMHAQPWANKIKNRTGKIENRSRTEPNPRIRFFFGSWFSGTEILGSVSVPRPINRKTDLILDSAH